MLKLFKRLRFIMKFHKSVPFIMDFFTSGEVKRRTKLFYAVLFFGYIIFPFDIIPDFLAFFGIFDDIAIAVFLVNRMVNAAPDALKEKHADVSEIN